MEEFYESTKRFGPISTGHRQWRDGGHCAFVHGYGRHVKITFRATALDHRFWVMDFGDLKWFKSWLEGEWDHRTLLASDDPLLPELTDLHEKGGININVLDVSKGYGPGIEASCKYLYDKLEYELFQRYGSRVRVHRVEIWEHENNSASYGK